MEGSFIQVSNSVHLFPGNAAWANIRASIALGQTGNQIAGLPVNITDDTPIMDTLNFVCKLINSDPVTSNPDLNRHETKCASGNVGNFAQSNVEGSRECLENCASHSPHQSNRQTSQSYEDYYVRPNLTRESPENTRIENVELLSDLNGNIFGEKKDQIEAKENVRDAMGVEKYELDDNSNEFLNNRNVTKYNKTDKQEFITEKTNVHKRVNNTLKYRLSASGAQEKDISMKSNDVESLTTEVIATGPSRFQIISLHIPTLLMYLICSTIEFLISFLTKWFRFRLSVPPLIMLNILNSIVLYNGLRANLCLNYVPRYSFDSSVLNSGQYYRSLLKDKTKNRGWGKLFSAPRSERNRILDSTGM